MSNDSFYRPDAVPVFEAIYGPGLISLGGYAAVDEMVAGLDIRGKDLLDVGFGLGGIAHYLAVEYGARVRGVEVEAWMVDHAIRTAPTAVRDRVEFMTYDDNGRIPLPDDCIDLVYSKGVLTNVADKPLLFRELARLLRRGGEFCLIDWVAPEGDGPRRERLPLGDMSYKETAASYARILADCGCADIRTEDLSLSYLRYVEALQQHLSDPDQRDRFAEVFSDERRQQIIDSHAETANEIKTGKRLSVRILATMRQS